MNMPCCCAFQCQSRTEKKNGKTFHRFPFRNPDLVKLWTINIRRKNWKPTRFTLICSDHFTEDCFDRTGNITRLRDAAVPTLFKFPPHLQKKVPRPRTTKNSSRKTLRPAVEIKEKTILDNEKSDGFLYTICNQPPTVSMIAKSVEDRNGTTDMKSNTMDHTYAILQSPKKLKELLDASWEREAILREKLKISRQHERRSKVKIQTLRNIIKSLHAKKMSSKNSATQCHIY